MHDNDTKHKGYHLGKGTLVAFFSVRPSQSSQRPIQIENERIFPQLAKIMNVVKHHGLKWGRNVCKVY